MYSKESHQSDYKGDFIVVEHPSPVQSEEMKKDTCYWVVKPGQGLSSMRPLDIMQAQNDLGLVFHNASAARVKEDNINLFLKDDV